MKRNQNQKALTETNPKRTGTLVWWWINKNDRRVVTGLGKILECGIRESNIRTSITKNWATWPTSWSNLSEYRMMLYFGFVCFVFYVVLSLEILWHSNRTRYIICTSTWLYILNICIYTYIPNKTHLVYYWVEVIYFLKWEKYTTTDVCELNLKPLGVIELSNFTLRTSLNYIDNVYL